jgi:hypothetical protein
MCHSFKRYKWVKLSLCLNNYPLRHEDVGGSGCIDPCLRVFFSLLLQPHWGLASDFHFMIILQMVGLLRRVISSSQGLYLNIWQHEHRINTHTKYPCLVWDSNPRSPASELAKTVHALDRSATVTGCLRSIKNPWLLARTRTIPTERLPLVGEVSAYFCG